MMLDLSPYQKPALQFSGGKDSLACLYLYKDQLDHLPVYWLNTGDGCPETLAIIAEVRKWIPHFVEVRSDVKTWRDTFGYPSDIVPAPSHPFGLAYGMSSLPMTPRFDCCLNNLMKPIHDRMIADGVDAVIRGTKLADTGKVPAEGPTGAYDILLPIRDWSHAEVFAYLAKVGAPRNPIYEHFNAISAPECFGCTAWWNDGKASYLRERHPQQYKIYKLHLTAIMNEVRPALRELEGELA